MKLIMIFVCVFIIVSQKENDQFVMFYSSIPVRELPMVVDCTADFGTDQSNIDKSLKLKYNPDGSFVYGRIYLTAKFISIVYYDVTDQQDAVRIITYNKKGVPIDTLNLSGTCYPYTKTTRGDFTWTVYADYSIVYASTIYTEKYDSNNVAIPNTLHKYTESIRYKLLGTGYFTELNSIKKKVF